MWYKEWLLARSKQSVVLILYAAAGFLTLVFRTDTLWGWSTLENQSVYHSWFSFGLVFLIGGAMIGGVDAIAAEKNDNTLSFLMSRPVSRLQIYSQKFLTNAAVMIGAYSLVNLLVWGIDQLPHTIISNGMDDCFQQVTYTTQIEAYSMPFNQALGQTSMAIMLGLAILSVTTCISIFGRNVIHSLILSMIVLFVLTISYIKLTDQFGYNQSIFADLNFNRPFHLMVLSLITIFFLGLGLRLFSRKEF